MNNIWCNWHLLLSSLKLYCLTVIVLCVLYVFFVSSELTADDSPPEKPSEKVEQDSSEEYLPPLSVRCVSNVFLFSSTLLPQKC